MKPRLLDLFCGAGGAAVGYARAGFDVVGVDLAPQPRYPFPFVQADAMTYPLDGFDIIHASPVCKEYSRTRGLWGRQHPRMLEAVRERLRASGKPWVVENVAMTGKYAGTMPGGVVLCGTMFGLKVYRHRWFESSHLLFAPRPCSHPSRLLPGYVTVYGGVVRGSQTGNRGNVYKTYPVAIAREAMGIDWMIQRELSQAIPPAYTYWLGMQLRSLFEDAKGA